LKLSLLPQRKYRFVKQVKGRFTGPRGEASERPPKRVCHRPGTAVLLSARSGSETPAGATERLILRALPRSHVFAKEDNSFWLSVKLDTSIINSAKDLASFTFNRRDIFPK
jgi:hypothetical protein